MNAPAQAGPPGEGLELGAPSVAWLDLWAMAWPLVLTNLVVAGVSLLDVSIATWLGPNQAAAVGPCLSFLMVMGAFVTCLSVGLQALVARAIGAGDRQLAIQGIRKGLTWAGLLTLLLLPFLWWLTPLAFAWTGAPTEVVQVGARYLRGQLLALLPLHLLVMLLSAMRGAGLPQAVMWATLADGLSWGLASYGLGWLAGWGMDGLVVAYGVGKLLGLGVAWHQLQAKGLGWPWRAWVGAWGGQSGWELWRVGWPAGGQVLARNLGMLAYYSILNALPHPAATTAAFAAAFRLEGLAFMPTFALNLAAASLVGRALGAGEVAAAKQAAWRLAGLGVGVLSLTGAAFAWWAPELAQALGGQDPQVQALMVSYLRISAVGEPLLALAMVLNGALQGAGATQLPMWSTFLAQIGFRLPLAWGLAVGWGWGATGAWAAIPISLWVQASLLTWLFRRGSWAVTGVKAPG